MGSLNVNSLNQSSAFNVDINALNAYNQNNSLCSISIINNSEDTAEYLSDNMCTYVSEIEKYGNAERLDKGKYSSEFNKITDSFTQSSDFAQTDILEQTASKYVELRNSIFQNYNDEDIEIELNTLDRYFEKSIKKIASVFKNTLSATQNKSSWYHQLSEIYEAYKTSSDESSFSSVKTLSSDGTSHIVNIEASFSSSEFSFAFTSYDIPYDESISSKLNNIYDNVIHLAENAVQYFLDGNSVPVTDEEKEAFNEYISKDSDGTIGNLSYSDLKTAANICNSLDEIISTVQSRSDFESLYSAINNSDFSDDLKGLFNNALYCIRIENSNIGEDNSDVEERIQELLEQRELMKLEMQKAQADSSISGEEKYSMYIKNAKQNTAIDSSLDDIINEIINYYNDEQ